MFFVLQATESWAGPGNKVAVCFDFAKCEQKNCADEFNYLVKLLGFRSVGLVQITTQSGLIIW